MLSDRETIPETLRTAAERGVGELVFHLDEGRSRLAWDELSERAGHGARELAARGVEPGDRVGLLGPNRPEWAVWAYATWTAGATLVPIQIPLRVRDAAAFSERLRSLVEAAGCRIVLADTRLLGALPDGIGVAWDLPGRTPGAHPPGPEPDDTAVIQFTSGSTAAPKGAVLSHRAVMAQMRLLYSLLGGRPADALSWMPLFHDLGLFGYLLTPVSFGGTCHILPTERFARDPAEWLRLIGSTRVARTTLPGSALGAAIRAAARRSEQIDLSSLEIAWFAAEGVDPEVADRLIESAQRFRLPLEALGSTYGLAEAVLAVAATPPGDGLRFDRVGLTELVASGVAAPAGAGPARRIACCGRPAPGTEVRIMGADGALAERHVGEILVRGPSLMQGYVGEDVPDPWIDGWLRTGDAGYLADGELYITGRLKDMVIVMGHNYYPEDFEWAAGRVPEVRAGRCVAFADVAGEEVVVLVEARAEADPGALSRKVRRALSDAVGIAPGEVLVLPRDTVEKTTSGKLRRAAMRDAYLRGELVPLGRLEGSRS
ncbi:N/A [soil metagenome]